MSEQVANRRKPRRSVQVLAQPYQTSPSYVLDLLRGIQRHQTNSKCSVVCSQYHDLKILGRQVVHPQNIRKLNTNIKTDVNLAPRKALIKGIAMTQVSFQHRNLQSRRVSFQNKGQRVNDQVSIHNTASTGNVLGKIQEMDQISCQIPSTLLYQMGDVPQNKSNIKRLRESGSLSQSLKNIQKSPISKSPSANKVQRLRIDLNSEVSKPRQINSGLKKKQIRIRAESVFKPISKKHFQSKSDHKQLQQNSVKLSKQIQAKKIQQKSALRNFEDGKQRQQIKNEIASKPKMSQNLMPTGYNSIKQHLFTPNTPSNISNSGNVIRQSKKITPLFANKSPIEAKKLVSFILYKQFQLIIAGNHNVFIKPQTQVLYKAYIAKGNNGILVKSLLKSRPWWGIKPYSEIDNCNLIWTEWRKNKIIDLLKRSQPQETVSIGSFSSTTGNKSYKNGSDTPLAKVATCNNSYLKVSLPFFNGKLPQTFLNYGPKLLQTNFYQKTPKIIGPGQLRFMQNSKQIISANHIPGCLNLHSKKLLFKNIKKYLERIEVDVWSVIPQTYLITKGCDGQDYQHFQKVFKKYANGLYTSIVPKMTDETPIQEIISQNSMKSCEDKQAPILACADSKSQTKTTSPYISKNNQIIQERPGSSNQKVLPHISYRGQHPHNNIWICKPGQNSNRGHGITVAGTLEEIKNILRGRYIHSSTIIQKYMEQPCLFNRRKFDIRCYILITCMNSSIKGYWYNEGYIRTASKQQTCTSYQ